MDTVFPPLIATNVTENFLNAGGIDKYTKKVKYIYYLLEHIRKYITIYVYNIHT